MSYITSNEPTFTPNYGGCYYMIVGNEVHFWTADENGDIVGYPGEPSWTEELTAE
jgi:hypothetical protein